MNQPYYLLWDVVPPEQREDPTIAPQKLDFRNWGLPFQEVIRFGHKQSTIYYKNYDYDSQKYTQPVVKCDRAVTYEKNQPIKLTKTVAWMLSDGNWGVSFTFNQPINSPLEFWQKRRSRIIIELKDLAQSFDLSDRILPLFEKYQTLVDSYRDAGSAKFRDAIANSSESWLDIVTPETGNKPRDVLVEYLSIGVVE